MAQRLIQGISACCISGKSSGPPAILRRYISALKGLGTEVDTGITQAEKGEGKAIMGKRDNTYKTNYLLGDISTYRKATRGGAKK